jgi:hypothetical protein
MNEYRIGSFSFSLAGDRPWSSQLLCAANEATVIFFFFFLAIH